MEKQYVRKVQQMGNGLGIRIPPELCQEAEVGRGDNMSIAFNPETRGFKLGQVIQTDSQADNQPDSQADNQADNQPDNQTDNQADSQAGQADSQAGQAGQADSQADSQIKFCPNCGSNKIDVTGNEILCPQCNALFESVADGGFRLVKLNPLAGEIDNIEHRLEIVEQDVEAISEQVESESDEDEDDLFGEDEDKPWGFVGEALELVGAVFGTGTESDEDEDEDEDDL